MVDRNYWLDLFTGTTWQEFLNAGASISGFRETRWKTVQQVRPGDYLLCYLTGLSRLIGILEVTSPAFKDSSPIWQQDLFPCRVRVKPVITLEPEIAVPILLLKDELSIFDNEKGPSYWTGFVRSSPAKWKTSDGEAVVSAVRRAQENPVVRPIDPAKLSYRPKSLSSRVGPVTVPEAESEGQVAEAEVPAVAEVQQASEHAQVQWTLAKFGNDMGLDVWVARNDRNREIDGKRFTDLKRLKRELPLQFDEATNRTVELIDVLWLQRNTIVAAFEVESTTSVYSGLLRLSDLIAMQPNLNIPLFIVAPDARRDKVVSEVNRPTFSKLSPPMYQMCRFIAFSTLCSKLLHISEYVRFMKPEILDELAESCEIEEP